MKLERLSDAAVWATLLAVVEHGDQVAAAAALGVTRGLINKRIRIARHRWPNALPAPKIQKPGWAKHIRLPAKIPQAKSPDDKSVEAVTEQRGDAVRGAIGGPPIPDSAKPPEGFVVRRNSSEYDEEGNLRRQWIESGQGTADGYEIPPGHVVKGESTLLDANGNVLVQWVKTKEGSRDLLVDALCAAFIGFDGAALAIPLPEYADDDLLTVYLLPDLHFGMYAWADEAGADYDVDIAIKIATDSISALVAQSRPSKRAILLGLGDMFHANDTKALTPGSGNRLDVDTRWAKVFSAGAKLTVSLVDLIARKHEQTDVAFIPGNHDPDASISLTVALALFYSKIKRISVWQDPGIAWYYRFGKVLLGATHGHTMKPERMAMMMAADRPEDWGKTSFRYLYFGHIHRETASEIGPVRVESFSSPAAKDAWNAASGYRSGRALSAITHHREQGEIGRHRVNILAPKR
jgi:predicted phosphodiesterase